MRAWIRRASLVPGRSPPGGPGRRPSATRSRRRAPREAGQASASTSWAAVTPSRSRPRPPSAGTGRHAEGREPGPQIRRGAGTGRPAQDGRRGGRAHRAGDMPGHRVDRLRLTPVALGARASSRVPAGQAGGRRRRPAAAAAGAGGEVPRRRGGALAGDHRLARRSPGAVAAIEDPDPRVTEVAQHPPAARRRRGVRLVVDDHVRPLLTPARRMAGWNAPPRQRVTAARPRCPGQIGSRSMKTAPGRCPAR